MKQCKYIVADLETVVEDDTAVQQKTEAWSSAWVELFDDDKMCMSIDDYLTLFIIL